MAGHDVGLQGVEKREAIKESQENLGKTAVVLQRQLWSGPSLGSVFRRKCRELDYNL